MSGDFSFETVQQFDNHIDLSIPTYSNLREAILRLSTSFVPANALVYDLGCSTGYLLEQLAEQVGPSVRLVGIDVEENLLGQSRPDQSRLGQSVAYRVEKHRIDLTSEQLVLAPSNLVLSVFTLQFLNPSARQPLLHKIHQALLPGSAFIVAEKLYIDDGLIQDLFTFGYYDSKLKHFTAAEVLDKQLALRRIMRPFTEADNLALFAPFRKVYPFWQYLQFKAWLCIK